ncbi:MAG: hypothetical protein ACW981_17915 [Candidatus Hodarchaeales archaeon]|jgi:hypothetical protein
MITLLEGSIYLVTLVFYIIALILTLRLWFLLKKEKYWIGIPLAITSFAIHEFFEIYTIIFGGNFGILPEIFELLGSFFLIYLAFGLSRILLNVSDYLDNKEDFDSS